MSIFSDDLSDDLGVQKKSKKIYKIATFASIFVLLVISGFLYKYYNLGTQKEKNIVAKIEKASQESGEKKKKEVTQEYEKKIKDAAANPWQSYKTEDIFGAFTIFFPKDWKVNISKDMSHTEQFRFLADPNWVMATKGEKGPFTALAVSVINENYAKKVDDMEYTNKKKNIYTISDESVSGIGGKRFVWKNPDSKLKAVFVLLPFRDKTIKIGTEDYNAYSQTFESILKKTVINK